ncbi:MAG: MCE family protein [Gemmatimonadetes bacterium]|nr:MCE family protein [Gemmatimonadota bacterium]
MTDVPQASGRRTPSDKELADYVPPVTRGREARLGIFVIFGLLSFGAVLFMLTSPATLRGRHILHTVVDDAGGVRRGDPVHMRGVIIGRIQRFEMRSDGLVTISLEIEAQWEVPRGSTTRLGASGMFGGRTLEIVPTSQTVYYVEGDTLPGVGGRAGGILGSMDDLSGQASTVMTQLESFLNDETMASVQGGAREFEALLIEVSSVVREQRSAMSTLIETLQASAEGIQGAAEAGPDLASAIARADSVMMTLNGTSATLDGTIRTLRSLLDKIDSGEGTLAMLVNDGALYVSLTNASEQFLSLLQDFRDNPRKYINISIF